MKWFSEKEFEHEGIKCVCLATNGGWRCGYAGVGEEHPLYGRDYIGLDIEVHGGITFAGGEEAALLGRGLWWFGFDCNHYCDRADKTLFDDETKATLGYLADLAGKVRGLGYVENECRLLAEQLANWQTRTEEKNEGFNA